MKLIVKPFEAYFPFLAQKAIFIPERLKEYGSRIMVSEGHDFTNASGYYLRKRNQKGVDLQIKGFCEERKGFAKTLLHEVGHFVSLQDGKVILQDFLSYAYPNEERLLANSVPFQMDKVSNTKWQYHLSERMKDKELFYKDFEGFHLHFYHTSEPDNGAGYIIREFPISIGPRKFKEHLRYIKGNGEYISDYSRTNPHEDFAEHFSFYLVEEDRMKETCPIKTSFFDKFFKRVDLS